MITDKIKILVNKDNIVIIKNGMNMKHKIEIIKIEAKILEIKNCNINM